MFNPKPHITMMLIYNMLSQLNAMDINEAILTMDELSGFSITPEDPFSWNISVIRHGHIRNTAIKCVQDRFVVDDIAFKYSLLYKYYHFDDVFAEQVIARINVAIQIEANFRFN